MIREAAVLAEMVRYTICHQHFLHSWRYGTFIVYYFKCQKILTKKHVMKNNNGLISRTLGLNKLI